MLTQNPDCMKKIQDELDEVIGTDPSVKLTYANVRELKYLRRCIDETMRLYPQPPVYTRRSLVENEVPTMNGGTVKIPAQQDLLLSIYNMHRNPNVRRLCTCARHAFFCQSTSCALAKCPCQ